MAVLCVGFVGFNVAMNEFAMYGDPSGQEYRIWGYERATKYLFSQNYIPANFDGLLIGPSASDVMVDTRRLPGRIYNLSLNGGNVCELKALFDNVVQKRKLKRLVICLSPYILKDCEMKTAEIDPGLKQSILGSVFTFRFYLKKAKALTHPEIDVYRESWWGYRLNDPGVRGLDVAKAIRTSVESYTLDTAIDPEALEAFGSILADARKVGTEILIYHHPIPAPLFDRVAGRYDEFRQGVAPLLADGEKVVDFNTKQYQWFTDDYDNFSDPSHLSAKGAGKLLDVLRQALEL